VDLAAYLDRIGFPGSPRPDLPTLRAIHRRHLMAIPYENLDVQLGLAMTTDPEAAFDKLVTRRRGGWCYEMNGLLGVVLGEIGFKVTRLAGAVLRQQGGERAVGNHLILRVDLDQPYIADVGFGDGMLEPVPLEAGTYWRGGREFRLEDLDGAWWRLHNHPLGGAASYDFTLERAPETLLTKLCGELSTDPQSVFVQNAVCYRHTPEGILALQGRVLRRVGPQGSRQSLIESADHWAGTLAREFNIHLPAAVDLWPSVLARHAVVFGPRP
jgi:N-hydroxyarylamine O-acetyltransferase